MASPQGTYSGVSTVGLLQLVRPGTRGVNNQWGVDGHFQRLGIRAGVQKVNACDGVGLTVAENCLRLHIVQADRTIGLGFFEYTLHQTRIVGNGIGEAAGTGQMAGGEARHPLQCVCRAESLPGRLARKSVVQTQQQLEQLRAGELFLVVRHYEAQGVD